MLINNQLRSLKQEFIWEHLLHSVCGTLHTPPGSQSPVRKHSHLCSNLPVNSETTGLFVAFSPGRFSSKSISLLGQVNAGMDGWRTAWDQTQNCIFCDWERWSKSSIRSVTVNIWAAGVPSPSDGHIYKLSYPQPLWASSLRWRPK